MNERLERLFESSPQTKLGILFGTITLLSALYYTSFYMGVADEIGRLKADIEGPQGLHSKVFEKEAIARNLDVYEQEVELLDEQLALALKELPDKRDIHLFLDTISDKARNSGLEVPLFQPQAEQKKDFYAEVPVQLTVRGSFHQVATFFDEVGHLERIVNIEQFALTQPVTGSEQVQLTTNLIATTFRFLDESERPKPEEKEGSGAKSRRKKKE